MGLTKVGTITPPLTSGQITIGIGTNPNNTEDGYWYFNEGETPNLVKFKVLLAAASNAPTFKPFYKTDVKRFSDANSVAQGLSKKEHLQAYAGVLAKIGIVKANKVSKVKKYNDIIGAVETTAKKYYKPTGLKTSLEELGVSPIWEAYEGHFVGTLVNSVCLTPSKGEIEQSPFYLLHIKKALQDAGITLMGPVALLREANWVVTGDVISLQTDGGVDVTDLLLEMLNTTANDVSEMVREGDGSASSLAGLGIDPQKLGKAARNHTDCGATGNEKIRNACLALGGNPSELEVTEEAPTDDRLLGLSQTLDQELNVLEGMKNEIAAAATENNTGLEAELKANFTAHYKRTLIQLKAYISAYKTAKGKTDGKAPQDFVAVINALKAVLKNQSSGINSMCQEVLAKADAVLSHLGEMADAEFSQAIEATFDQFNELADLANQFADGIAKEIKNLSPEAALEIAAAIAAINTARRDVTEALNNSFSASVHSIISRCEAFETVEVLEAEIREIHRNIVASSKVNQKFARFEKASQFFVQKASALNAEAALQQTIANTDKTMGALRKIMANINKLPAIFTKWFKSFIPLLAKNDTALEKINQKISGMTQGEELNALRLEGAEVVSEINATWSNAFINLDKINGQINTLVQHLRRVS